MGRQVFKLALTILGIFIATGGITTAWIGVLSKQPTLINWGIGIASLGSAISGLSQLLPFISK